MKQYRKAYKGFKKLVSTSEDNRSQLKHFLDSIRKALNKAENYLLTFTLEEANNHVVNTNAPGLVEDFLLRQVLAGAATALPGTWHLLQPIKGEQEATAQTDVLVMVQPQGRPCYTLTSNFCRNANLESKALGKRQAAHTL